MGARSADPYGREIAGRIATEAARRGVCVVSGGALGVDIAAHRGALAAGGETVVVLGSGLDRAGPVSHLRDFERARARGAVISPFPLGQTPARWTYPRRNPWIAGLCGATVVVQAALRSGSLQTARAALALGRPVYVVPGPMDSPLHQGCHALVAEGARVLLDPAGFAASFPDLPQAPAAPRPTPEAEGPATGRALWAAASAEPRLLSELSAEAGLSVAEASLQATVLELEGWLRAAPGGRYARTSPGGR